LEKVGVDTSEIIRTEEAETGKAIIILHENGEN